MLRLSLGLGLSAGASSGTIATLALNFLTGSLDSRITFTRASNATLVDSTGKVTYAPNNLWLNSAATSGWSVSKSAGTTVTGGITDPLGGTTACQLDFTSTFDFAGQIINPIPAGTKIQSVWVKGDSAGTITLYGASGGSWNTQVAVTTSWTLVYTSFTYTGFETVSVFRNVGDLARVYVAFPQLEQVTYQTAPSTYNATTGSAYYGPRFDYNPSTLAARGLLIEEQRTNLCLRSQEFDNAYWTPLRATVTANSVAAPDGTTTTDTHTDDTSNNSHGTVATSGFTVSAATAYTFSVFAKKGTGRYFFVQVAESAAFNYGAIFDLQAGTITDTEAGGSPTASSSIQDYGNGWYRLIVTFTTVGTGIYLNTFGSDAAVPTYSGNHEPTYVGTGSTWYLWGAQLEAGAFATSYIPTTSATVTRSEDVVSMTGANFSDWYNQSEGTFVVEASKKSSSGYALSVSVSNGSASELMWFGAIGANSGLSIVDGGVTQANYNVAASLAADTFFKQAAAYKANDTNLATSGTAHTADTACTLPTVDRVRFGANFNGTSPLVGHIKSISYYNSRLPDATLQELTA